MPISEWIQILAHLVPLRSILGPLLFLIYVDDIINYVEPDILLFAYNASLLKE